MHSRAEIATCLSTLLIPFSLIANISGSRLAPQSRLGACTYVNGTEDFLTVRGEIGQCGGRLVISKRSEPKTLNPLTAADGISRDVIGLMTADLIHVNGDSQQTEAALAKSWTVSRDGKKYTLHLRRGLRFSDGHPFDADDVLFTFQSYLDERTHSPQRDLLVVSGKPISVEKIDTYSVAFTLAQPYAAAERLFDRIAILPRHLLHRSYETGHLASAWALNTPPAQIAGLGPFRLREYAPGQRIILERNPYYWKSDAKRQRLPYLDGIVSVFVANGDAEALRFESGETDVISRLSVANFAVLEKDQRRRKFRLYDLGPGFEYSFLFFNLNDLPSDVLPSLREKQNWFRQVAFRQAISAAIDQESIIRLVYRGRAYPLSVQVTPGNKLWANRNIPPPVYSPQRARQLLRQAGFSWGSNGFLKDAQGKNVRFSILVNAGNAQRVEMATIIQQDLKELGIEVSLVSLEYRTFLHHILTSYDYEAAIMTLADSGSDPNSEINVLSSHGDAHFWELKSKEPPPWQNEIDSLMRKQLIARSFKERKRAFDRVQELLWKNRPAIFLVSSNILVGAKERVGNFHPVLLGDYTLWNAEQLFIRKEPNVAGRS
jgi:peptide/nickel transport system substrate-binding protein